MMKMMMIMMITHLDVAADGVVCFVSLGFSVQKTPPFPGRAKPLCHAEPTANGHAKGGSLA